MIKLLDYKIVFETQEFSELRTLLSEKDYAAIVLLVDENTASFCLPLLQDVLRKHEYLVVQIQSGESHKTLDTCQYIWKYMMHNKLTRKSLVINLGGGVIGDMGGFCAATFKRGVDFVQVPTTLLAQVDASVGGKLGVDFYQLKNGVGLFANPQLVCLYPLFFKTLPFDQLRSGFAEVIKHALIADVSYWQQIVGINLGNVDWLPIVRQSVLIKKSIVEKDPTEKGCRKILNFGHTIGHAIESLSWETSKPLLHGEAIALGMIAEAFISYRLLGLNQAALNELTAFIQSIYPFYSLSEIDEQAILDMIKQDKKKERNLNAFSLITAIGKASYNHHVEDALIVESLLYYQQVYQSTI